MPLLGATAEPSTSFWADPAGVMLIGFGLFVLVFLSFRTKWKNKRKPAAALPASNTLAQQRHVERDMQKLLTELHEMARQMNAQIDTKAAKLEALIAEADQKIARLNGNVPADDAVETVAEEPQEEASIAPTYQHATLYELADEGHDVEEIARRTDRPRGEVELILALRRR
jgi:hypothetical protein